MLRFSHALQQCCLSVPHPCFLFEICEGGGVWESDDEWEWCETPKAVIATICPVAWANLCTSPSLGLAAQHNCFLFCFCPILVAFPRSGLPKVTWVTTWGQELRRGGPCVCGAGGAGVQTGGAEADGASWKGSAFLEDTRGIQAVQRECKEGVKKGNSTVTNSGETPRKALASLKKPLYPPADIIPRLNMSLCTLHVTHCQLPILSATSPQRGKLRSKSKAVVVMWDAETVTGPARNQ